MPSILFATESDGLFRQIDAALASDDREVHRVANGADVIAATKTLEPDLVLSDLQVGNMGGVAICIALRQEEGFDRLDKRPVALLLDRAHDVWLANEAKADGWLVKPLDPLRLRKLYTKLVAGGTFYEGTESDQSQLSSADG